MSLSSGLLPSNKVLKIRLVINLITLMQSMSSKSLSLIVVVVKSMMVVVKEKIDQVLLRGLGWWLWVVGSEVGFFIGGWWLIFGIGLWVVCWVYLAQFRLRWFTWDNRGYGGGWWWW